MRRSDLHHISLLLLLSLVLVTPCSAADESGGQIVLKEFANGSRSLRPVTVRNKWEVRWDSTEGASIYLYNEKVTRQPKPTSSSEVGEKDCVITKFRILRRSDHSL